MNIEEAIYQIRTKTNDREALGLDDDELLAYLNEAIQFICSHLIGTNSPEMVQEVKVETPEYTLPEQFVRFAGNFPVKVTGHTAKLLYNPPITLRFFSSYGLMQISDDMPFSNEALNQVAIKYACIMANSQQQFDVSQDKAITAELIQSISAAINGIS